jgi:hypothetical protein
MCIAKMRQPPICQFQQLVHDCRLIGLVLAVHAADGVFGFNAQQTISHALFPAFLPAGAQERFGIVSQSTVDRCVAGGKQTIPLGTKLLQLIV